MTTPAMNEDQIRGVVSRLYEPLDRADYEIVDEDDLSVTVQAIITVSREEWDEAVMETTE